MANKTPIEVGFLYRGQLYVFWAMPPDPVAFQCEPGTNFKKLSAVERIEIECVIKPQGNHTGQINAVWNRLEKRLIDAAPSESFIFQPEQSAEQEELFNKLLITCEHSLREAIYFETKAREDNQQIDASRKHLS